MKWIIVVVACIICVSIVLGVDHVESVNIMSGWMNSIGSAFNRVAGLTGILSDRNAYLISLKSGNLGTIAVDDHLYDIATYISDNLIPDLFTNNPNIENLDVTVSPSVYSFTLKAYYVNREGTGLLNIVRLKNYHDDVRALRMEVTFETKDNGPHSYNLFIYPYNGELFYLSTPETYQIGQITKSLDTIEDFKGTHPSYYDIMLHNRIVPAPIRAISIIESYYVFQNFNLINFNETTYHIETIMGEIIKVKGV